MRIALIFVILASALCAADEEIVFADFENGLGGWITEGDAFGISAKDGDKWDRSSEGRFFADSLHVGEPQTGVLRSPTFKCPDEIRFLANGWDRREGNGGRNFYRLRLADGTLIAQSGTPCQTGPFVEMRWQTTQHKDKEAFIEVVDGAAEGAFSWLAIDNVRFVDKGPLIPVGQSDLYAIGAGYERPAAECAGIAFALWPSHPIYDNGSHTIPINCRLSEIFLYGHISTYDFGCAHWGAHTDFTRDFGKQQMIGDRAGEIVIRYEDGSETAVPLIFGFTLWWDVPWRGNPEPIRSNTDARLAFESACKLKETFGEGEARRFVSAIACEDKVCESVTFIDSPTKDGCPRFDAMSVRTNEPVDGMTRLAHHAFDEKWLEKNRITADLLTSRRYLDDLKRLKSEIGMSDSDLPESLPIDVPDGFTGPRMTLKGGIFADILTSAYYHTVHSAATLSIRKDGYVHCAPPDMPDYNAYNSIGTYQTISRGAGSSWTRGYEYLRDLAEWGYTNELTRAIDWMDSCLYYYPEKSPARFERDGKQIPWPAHWATTADHPPATAEAEGCNEIPGDENDGHALTMMLRYSTWLATGKSETWLRQRWKPAIDAAEWLCFVLDYTRQDALYCESEGTCYGVGFDRNKPKPYDAYPHYDIFTNVLGELALRQYADMAESLGENDKAVRWRSYADRIRRGTMAKCVDESKLWGAVWRVHPNSVWPQFDERMTPIFELPYYSGFDAGGMDARTLEISRNSFRMQIGDPPDYHHGLGLGYGQGWIASAALLLDEMGTAKPLVENLARYMYFPKHPHPFTACEGVVVNEDGDFRVRNGTIGIDEGLFVTRVFRLLMGIDDAQPERALFIPRLPDGIESIQVDGHPVTTKSQDGSVIIARITFSYQKSESGAVFSMKSSSPLASAKVRMGPFKESGDVKMLTVDGKTRDFRAERSGDSWWVWIDLGKAASQAECVISRPE
ncbi:MAG TPA: hypothetical protein PL033_14500 [Candidatus Brocadiia bacterium]|nr:hypothetical protein [Candidatus Brocadiia bacterium]